MSSHSDSILFSSLTISKLHTSVSGKSCSLHRWVLLKNSIHQSSSITSNTSSSSSSSPYSSQSTSNQQSEEEESVEFFHPLHPTVTFSIEEPEGEEVLAASQISSFMFPDLDTGKFVRASQSSASAASEAQWLDSLLETLVDDEDDSYRPYSAKATSTTPVDDDDLTLCNPVACPLSPSDDLSGQSSPFYPSSSLVQYSHVSYSPYDQPSCSFNITCIPSISHSDYEHPLPYHDNDVEVPDAIEDSSDDESDAPNTPLGSSSSSLPDSDSSTKSISTSPPEPSRLRQHSLHVYNQLDSNILTFEIDPLPFPDQHHRNPSFNF